MKKLLIVSVAIAVIACLVAGPAFAAPGNGIGAVKADLTYYDPAAGPGVDPVVGSVILNTTASGILIVNINIDTVCLEDYDVRVHINNSYKPIFEDVLSTNAKGQGNAQVKVDVSSFVGDSITVDVVLRPSFSPNTTPCYTTNWPTDVIVPLK